MGLNPAATCDALIVGAGPAGLSLALSLAALELNVGVVERQPEAALAEPQDDGREIALTHSSLRILRALGAAQDWDGEGMSPILAARVCNGRSARFLQFQAQEREGPLGFLVANHRIRRALYRRVRQQPRISLLCGRQVLACGAGADEAWLRTEADGRLTAPLLVAADSRHSETRRAMGIAAAMQDFGRTMLVMRARHERPHHGAALEWFDYGRTIATLPLRGEQSSVIVTVPGAEAERLAALPEAAFEARLNSWLGGRLGELKLASAVHRYPLVAVYAERFAGRRFALAGDAAVGMHPVTAHGFNFGLSGQQLLAQAIAAARDPAAPAALRDYERRHRLRTWPLYQATNLIARLYAEEAAPARLARGALLALGEHVPLARRAIVRELRA